MENLCCSANSCVAHSRRRRVAFSILHQEAKPNREANQTVDIIPEVIHSRWIDHI